MKQLALSVLPFVVGAGLAGCSPSASTSNGQGVNEPTLATGVRYQFLLSEDKMADGFVTGVGRDYITISATAGSESVIWIPKDKIIRIEKWR